MRRAHIWWQSAFLLAGIVGLQCYFFPDKRIAALIDGDGHARGRPSAAISIAQPPGDGLLRPGEERHLRHIRQLTFGGENAEAYWSFDGQQLVFQSTRDALKADQIFVMNADGSNVRMVSTGKGRTTCAYFSRDGSRIFYASTHLAGPEPPPPPDLSMGYVWGVFPQYEIFRARLDQPNAPKRLTYNEGYDAEATLSPDGERMVFTSLRNGDLDIYSMTYDGDDLRRLTTELGYDGGPFYSHDGKLVCYRAHHPKTDAEVRAYRDLLARHLVRPTQMELFVMNADGSEKRQVTHTGAANFCPFFTPDDRQMIFASNMKDPHGRNFDLYLINLDGTGLEQVTFEETFDGFPMFSPDGKQLVWASNRNAKQRGETNIFVAGWVP
ncbi:MAG: PD40 domain-containing protein [Armatimonadetes bacterium]|nr:PD40 domain-containing protein [Armatimonadota bacterium]